jgi:hypothetical protein
LNSKRIITFFLTMYILFLFQMCSLENRSSVNMGDGSSAGTFRTLQRSPIRRMSEETYPALTPQVISHWLSYSHKSIHCNHLQMVRTWPSCELRAGSDRGQSSDVIGTQERFHHINRNFCRDYLFARPRDVLLCASHIHLKEQLPRRGFVWRVKSLLSDNCTLFYIQWADLILILATTTHLQSVNNFFFTV